MIENKKTLLWYGILCLLAIMALATITGLFLLRSKGLRHVVKIREEALSQVRTLSQNEAWIKTQVANYKDMTDEEWDDCVLDGLIVLPKGEWLVYYYRTSKQDSLLEAISCILARKCPYDIFLGKASDGKWYTTKYHFCLRMLMLRLDGPSANFNV